MSLPGPRLPHLPDDLLHGGGAAYEVFPAEGTHGWAGDTAGADQVAVPAAQLSRNVQCNTELFQIPPKLFIFHFGKIIPQHNIPM